jgi:glycosyltransferase involved in cell wall biosynthesis
VSEREKVEALNACDLLVMPSVGEAFGIVYLEAWALGKPIIGARAGAVPSIVSNGCDGVLVSPGDTEDLIRQIEQMMIDPLWRRELGLAGSRKVRQRYTVSRIADIVEGACARVLRQRNNLRRKGS